MKRRSATISQTMKALAITAFCLNFGVISPTAPTLGAAARAQDLKARRLQKLQPILNKANARQALHQSNAARYDTAIRNISALEQAPLKTEADLKRAIDILQRNEINDSMVFGKGFTMAINLPSFKNGVIAEANRLTARGVAAKMKSRSLSLSGIGGFNDLKTALKQRFNSDAAMLKRVGARLQQASRQRGVSLSSPKFAPENAMKSAFVSRLLGEKSLPNPFISALSHRRAPADNLTVSPVRTDASPGEPPQFEPITAGVLGGIALAAIAYIIVKYAEEKADDIEEDPDTGVSQMGECRKEAKADRTKCINRANGDFFKEAGCWAQYAVDEAACLLLPL